MIMASLKTHVIVELRKLWQAVAFPVGLKRLDNKGGCSDLGWPGFRQGCPERAGCKHLQKAKTIHAQVLDDIKVIQVHRAARQSRQVPPCRRCRVADSPW